ncbi:MAG: hypothetical protein CMM46_12165 [Rhodospirillaceae bacterium]|nr:hypothetical protein [Rhodospirillaceae bacterium]|tara:strand:- start:877 stop:1350 length:474 start_codon:yes stop_codon:yes gene_type:complete
MTLRAGSAVTIDELDYDPAGQDSSASFDFACGLLGLVSGDVAKSGDMVVTTTVSTIGIRGTTLPVKAVGVFRAANGQIQVTLFASNDDTGQPQVITLTAAANGNPGSITVTTGGEMRALTHANATLTVSANGTTTQGVLDATEVANTFSAAAPLSRT